MGIASLVTAERVESIEWWDTNIGLKVVVEDLKIPGKDSQIIDSFYLGWKRVLH